MERRGHPPAFVFLRPFFFRGMPPVAYSLSVTVWVISNTCAADGRSPA